MEHLYHCFTTPSSSARTQGGCCKRQQDNTEV